jgi:tetratricopeptide (TPR) repeat protein
MTARKKKRSKKSELDAGTNESTTIAEGFGGKLGSLIANRTVVAGLLFLISFAVYIPSIHDGLVWDDVRHVQKLAPRIHDNGFSLNSFLPDAKGERTAKYFRPTYAYSLALDYEIWGENPKGFHIDSIILHSITTVLLYFMVILLFREFQKSEGDKVAFLSSLLFAVYPLHVESVSFIAARGDILAAIFFSACMILYLHSFRRYWLILPAGFFLYMSFTSKEVALTFPLIILVFDIISRRILKLRTLFKYLIIIVPLIFYFYARSKAYISLTGLWNKAPVFDMSASYGFGEFVNIFVNSYLFYLKKLLFPYDLNMFIWGIPPGDALQIIIAFLVIIVACAVFVISFRKKENVTAFGLLWIFATLGPAIIIAIYPMAITRYAERFLYVPSMGYCLLIGYALIQAGRKSGIIWLPLAAGGVLLLSFVVVTVKGQEVWRDNISFWEATVRKAPEAITPRLNYGDALRESGKVDQAIEQFMAAFKSGLGRDNRGKHSAAKGLGISYFEKGSYSQAEKWFRAALEYDPAYEAEFNLHMGHIALKKNDLAGAQNYFKKCTEIDPRYSKAHYLLGWIYLKQALDNHSVEQLQLAEKSLLKALRLSPDLSVARTLLARTYLEMGNKRRAREEAKIVLETSKNVNELRQARAILNLN